MERVPSEAPALENAGPEVLEHHVALGHEPADDLLPLRRVQIERHQLLVPVVDGEPVGAAVLDRSEPPQVVAAAGNLGLDHLGAELRHQRAAERTGDHLGELEDADSLERQAGLCHGAAVYQTGPATMRADLALPWRGGGMRADGGRQAWPVPSLGALKTLVDVERRHHQPRDLRQRRDLPPGAGAGLRPRLALHRPREPDPEARRLLRVVDGRGVGHPLPRPRRADPRLPELLPASRHEGLPLRRGQHRGVHVPLPRLELRRPTARWSACPSRRTPTARSSTGASGASSRSRRWRTTRARSGRRGTRRRRRSSNISAATSSTSTCCSTPGTAARAAPR